MWVVEWAERVGSDKGIQFLFTLIIAITLAIFLWGWLIPFLKQKSKDDRDEREAERKYQAELLGEQKRDREELREERRQDRLETKRLNNNLIEISMKHTEAMNEMTEIAKRSASAVEANNELRRDNNEIHQTLQAGVDDIKKDMRVLSDNISDWNKDSSLAFTNIERKLDEMAQPKNA